MILYRLTMIKGTEKLHKRFAFLKKIGYDNKRLREATKKHLTNICYCVIMLLLYQDEVLRKALSSAVVYRQEERAR